MKPEVDQFKAFEGLEITIDTTLRDNARKKVLKLFIGAILVLFTLLCFCSYKVNIKNDYSGVGEFLFHLFVGVIIITPFMICSSLIALFGFPKVYEGYLYRVLFWFCICSIPGILIFTLTAFY